MRGKKYSLVHFACFNIIPALFNSVAKQLLAPHSYLNYGPFYVREKNRIWMIISDTVFGP